MPVITSMGSDNGRTLAEASSYIDMACALMEEYKSKLPFSDLESSIALLRKILSTHDLHVEAMESLGHALCLRCMHSNLPADLQESLKVYNAISKNVTGKTLAHGRSYFKQDQEDIERLLLIAKEGLVKFTTSISLESLDTIVSYLRTSLAALRPRTHPEHLRILPNLILALYFRFHYSKDVSDLDDMVFYLRNAVECCREEDIARSNIIQLLRCAHLARFTFNGEALDLKHASHLNDERQTFGSKSKTNATQQHEVVPNLQKQIGEGNLSALNHTVYLFWIAIPRIPVDIDDYSRALIDLAAILLVRFEQDGRRNIDQAILLSRRALELLSPIHDSRSNCIANLAIALHARSKLKDDTGDLNEAIPLFREALGLITIDHHERPGLLGNFATALETKFEQTDELDNLDEAISLYRQAVELLSQNNGKQLKFLDPLAAVLQTRYKHTGRRGDLDGAILLRKQIIEILPQSDPNRLTHLLKHTAILQSLSRQTKQPTDVDEVITSIRAILDYLPPSHPLQSDALVHLADNLATRFTLTRQRPDLDEEIFLHRKSLQLRTPPDPSRSATLNNLALALSTRFEISNQQDDLDEAISFHREALELRSHTHPDRYMSLINLASSLECRFRQAGRRCDLDEAILLNEAAVDLCILPHAGRDTALNNLANALDTLFEQTGQLERLDRAILFHREALELRPNSHPDRPSSLNNLGHALQIRFKHTGQQGDLDDAIAIHRESLELHGPSHLHRCYSLDNLANALTDRFRKTGQSRDLEDAVILHREALKLRAPPHPDRSMSLNNLASVLQDRFDISGQQQDLNEAIVLNKEALNLRPANHPSRHMSLNNLANALMSQFDQTGQPGDLDQAISLHKEALTLRASMHPDRPSSLMNLASAFGTHFKQTGQRRSLDEAIICYREALQLFSSSHPLRPMCLNNLANRLIMSRSGTKLPGQQDPLDEAIALVTEALQLQVHTQPDWPLSLFHLAGLLQARCEGLATPDQQSLINQAVVLCKSALDFLPPTHIHRQEFTSRLAGVLHSRFVLTGQREDIDEAIALERQNLQLRGSTHPDRPTSLACLASSLQDRFSKADHDRLDFNESVTLNNEAVDLFPLEHPSRFTCLTNLGKIYKSAYSVFGDSGYLEEAFNAFSLAMQTPSKRLSFCFEIATLWCDYADQYQHPSALKAYGTALQHLSQMSSLSLDIYSRQNVLRAASDGLARKAAQSAIAHARLDNAIEFLEEGRAIFWSQILHLRSPLNQLRDAAPELADKLRDIAAELERGSYRSSLDALDGRSKITLEMEASRFRRLDEDWCGGLREARSLKGFEGFLQPSSIASLQVAAADFPVVFLVPNEKNSDCIIMTSTIIHHIPLLDVSVKMLRNLVDMIKYSSSHSTSARSLSEDTDIEDGVAEDSWDNLGVQDAERSKGAFGRTRRSRPSSNSIFEYVLKTLWYEVVKPIMEFLDLRKSDTPPMLQWCPTGIFTFLPLHAAGCYNPIISTSTECASDYIVSSYTPTAGLLLPVVNGSSTPTSMSDQPIKMVTVVDSGLPFASKELEKIKNRVPVECFQELGISNAPAYSIETICSGLQTASMVHFACHGIQDQSNPLDSALFVDDGKLPISRIMQQQPPSGALAFLCACETGTGDSRIPDESMSLGATLLFSGYRSVVATMWKIADADGPTIADAFYEEIFRGPDGKTTSRPDTSGSARALHVAVQKLRANGVDFSRWVPFIHLGRG